MSTWIGLTVLATAVAMMALGCGQQPAATAAVIEENTYTLTPAAMKVKIGIVTGDVTELKVTERVEQDSRRVDPPAKLTGTLRLKNTSANQTVWLVSGKIQYVDARGQPIKLEETGTEATLKFATHGSGRLEPGQEATRSLDVAFPAAALKAKRLKEIRLQLAYVPSPYTGENVLFTVSIGQVNEPGRGGPLKESFDSSYLR